ncbi:exonuclease domain-containing protein [Spiroplasma endosymbiont of Crioceris asparagi]|uniref:exonuclease domain-containing protein n=1 Tax=Spiroplasma endosymbiont of Crioceris asparagi TaxID=3066286 RepID=UPI0030D22377
MSKIVFLDFEVANKNPASICQIGMYVYDNGKKIKISQKIKPWPFKFDDHRSELHKITADVVANSPTFKNFWKQITKFFNGTYLICAHSAWHDMRYLQRAIWKFHIHGVKFNYICSQETIKLLLPKDIKLKMGLKSLAEGLNLEFKNHDGFEDAKMIYQIIKKLFYSVEVFEILCKRNNYNYKSF